MHRSFGTRGKCAKDNDNAKKINKIGKIVCDGEVTNKIGWILQPSLTLQVVLIYAERKNKNSDGWGTANQQRKLNHASFLKKN